MNSKQVFPSVVAQAVEQRCSGDEMENRAAVSMQAGFRGVEACRLPANQISSRLSNQVHLLLAAANALTGLNLLTSISSVYSNSSLIFVELTMQLIKLAYCKAV